jgi:hypothetical protein
MGKTFKNLSHRYDDEKTSGRSGKHSKHSNNRKSGGMKTLNSYVDEDIEFDDDIFDDDIEMTDDIQIQHIQNDKP